MFNLLFIVLVFVNTNNPVCKSFLLFSTSLELTWRHLDVQQTASDLWFHLQSYISQKSFTSSCELNALVWINPLILYDLFDFWPFLFYFILPHTNVRHLTKTNPMIGFQPKQIFSLISCNNYCSYWSWSIKLSISSSSKDRWNISVMVSCWGSWQTAGGLKTGHVSEWTTSIQ